MCGMCPDYVASCWICTQPMRGNPDKTIGKQFYLEMGNNGKFCEHFVERYKTDSPSFYSHIDTMHLWEEEYVRQEDPYDCEDHCTAEGWWTREQVEATVEAFIQWGSV